MSEKKSLGLSPEDLDVPECVFSEKELKIIQGAYLAVKTSAGDAWRLYGVNNDENLNVVIDFTGMSKEVYGGNTKLLIEELTI